jgi:formylglycine-generating enzyme required for sulfatase activity
MPLTQSTALAAAVVLAIGATGVAGTFAVTVDETVPIAETATVAPGSFTHSLPGEFLKDGHPVAAPRILATIKSPLEIMKYQVSATEYQRCVEVRACQPADSIGRGNVPVTGVSRLDAEAYAAWYSDATGDRWRLPTDREWAFAAGERFAADIEGGQSDPHNPALRWLALYRTESAMERKPDPAPRLRGAFGTNSNGVADLAGNIWEWTSTCYVHATLDYGGKGIETAVENCGVHVVEGFHRTYMSNFIRDGKSGGCAVGTPPDNLGFRLVRDRPTLIGAVLRYFGDAWR